MHRIKLEWLPKILQFFPGDNGKAEKVRKSSFKATV